MNKQEALRFNENKLRFDLIPSSLNEEVSKVLEFGASKYGEYNYQKGLKWSKCIASLKRHLNAFEKGEDYDEESNIYHISHLITNALFLLEYYKLAPEYDDRKQWYKKPLKKVFIDIDGVIAGFEEAFSKKYGLDSSPHDWKDHRYTSKLQEITNDKNFWINEIQPLINPEELDYPISGYCTARSIPIEWIQEWLNKHMFPDVPIIRLDYGSSKVDKLKEAGCEVFIDDSIYNFIELNSSGILCYLATRSHNIKYNVGHLRVKNLKDLIKNKL